MNLSLKDFSKSLFERFEDAGIPLLLAGGWAVNSYGFSRNTLDVDWVWARSRLQEAITLMSDLGFDAVSDGMATRFRYRRDFAFPAIDLIWVNDETFARMIGEIDPGLGVRLVNFEGLIAMKLHALKDDESRKGRDLRDLQELLAKHPGRIPEHDLRAMCEKYAGPDAYHRVKLAP